jgi:phage gp29-like protein
VKPLVARLLALPGAPLGAPRRLVPMTPASPAGLPVRIVQTTGPALPTNPEARGTPGTEIYSGYAAEEYLANLRGTQRADEFDKMRRSDAQVASLLTAVIAPILRATWRIEPWSSSDPEAVADADLMKQILFEDLDRPWIEKLEEMLSMCGFGHSVFEMVDRVETGHPLFGTYHTLRALGFRSQRTLERWVVDPKTANLVAVEQMAHGDLQSTVELPAQFLLVFSVKREGANYEGISLLRPCYGNWKRKNHYLKLIAIGVEKLALPTPRAVIPAAKENSPERAHLEEALRKLIAHEQGFLTVPEGWTVDFLDSNFDPSKVEASVDREDERMVRAFLANFLSLGQGGNGGAFALSQDLSDFFLSSIEYLADVICGQVNRVLIPRMIQLNRGKRAKYPKLAYGNISDKAGEEFAKVMQLLFSSGGITPDEETETHLRERFNLPKASLGTRRAPPAPTAPGGAFGSGRSPGAAPAGGLPGSGGPGGVPADPGGAPIPHAPAGSTPPPARPPTLSERVAALDAVRRLVHPEG